MLDKKEKMVMLYLCKVCSNKKTYLISADQIAEFVSQKFILSVAELDDIMISLCKDNYLDFVVSEGKRGYFYCVNLKNKGLTYIKDLKKRKAEIAMLIFRTVGIAVLSFIIGIILRAIFNA